MTTCKQPKLAEKLQSTTPVRQGLSGESAPLGGVVEAGDPPQPPFKRGENLLKVTSIKGENSLKVPLIKDENYLKVPLNKGDLGGSKSDGEVLKYALSLGSSKAEFTPPASSLKLRLIKGGVRANSQGLGKAYLYLLQKSIPGKSSGFTIVECLLAIILVGILMTAITPVMVLSVATRVQARRVEQATQAARSYIDAVQSGTIKPPTNTVGLYEADLSTPGATNKTYLGSDRSSFAQIPAPPSAPINCKNDPTQVTYPYCSFTPKRPNLATLYCVDNDGKGCTSNSSKNYIVQAFRSIKSPGGTPDSTDDGKGGYVLGVRVYRADAFDGVSTLRTTNLNSGKKVASYAGGKGNQFAPLAELTTEIRPVAGDSGSAMKSLCDRYGGCKSSTPVASP